MNPYIIAIILTVANKTQPPVDAPMDATRSASQGVDVSAVSDSAIGESKALSVPIFTEQVCSITRPPNALGFSAVDEMEPVSRVGSAFAYKSGGRVVLVTAAHVVPAGNSLSEFKSASGVLYSVKKGHSIELSPCRVRIGGLSVVPKRWVVDYDMDVALFELEPGDLTALNLEVLVPGAVKRGDEIKIWGFPVLSHSNEEGKPLKDKTSHALSPSPSASQTSQRSDITDVRPGEVVCAPLNGKETRGGFSGGPIINAKGQVVGMIMRSTAETTRCRAMPSIDKLAEAFNAGDDAKSGKAKPPANAPQVVDYTDPPPRSRA